MHAARTPRPCSAMRLKRERADSRAAPRGETLTRSPFFRWMTMFEMSITCSESPRKILLADIEMENGCTLVFLFLSFFFSFVLFEKELTMTALNDSIWMLPTCFQLWKILLVDDDRFEDIRSVIVSSLILELWKKGSRKSFLEARQIFFAIEITEYISQISKWRMFVFVYESLKFTVLVISTILSPIRDALMNDHFDFIHAQEEEKKKRRKRMSKWSLQAARFKITQRTQKRFWWVVSTLWLICVKSPVYPWHARCVVTPFCIPRHRSIQPSLGGPPQREHLRSNDPGVGHGLNSSKFVKSLPLSGLSSTNRMRLFSRQKSIRLEHSARHNVASLAANRRR